jgi:signal transduction histidine kinase
MAPETVEQITKGRFTSKKHGNGLGLAMVRNVIERQGGELTIRSTLGEGTTIELWLPIAGIVKND